MLAGNLVIGADSGGTTEILGDGKYGMLFENGNPISLARTLIKAISEKEKSVLLAKAGQNYAHSEFTATHNADQIISVYQNILGKT